MKTLLRLIKRLFRQSRRPVPVEVARRLKVYEMERGERLHCYRAAWQKAWDAKRISERPRVDMWRVK